MAKTLDIDKAYERWLSGVSLRKLAAELDICYVNLFRTFRKHIGVNATSTRANSLRKSLMFDYKGQVPDKVWRWIKDSEELKGNSNDLFLSRVREDKYTAEQYEVKWLRNHYAGKLPEEILVYYDELDDKPLTFLRLELYQLIVNSIVEVLRAKRVQD